MATSRFGTRLSKEPLTFGNQCFLPFHSNLPEADVEDVLSLQVGEAEALGREHRQRLKPRRRLLHELGDLPEPLVGSQQAVQDEDTRYLDLPGAPELVSGAMSIRSV